MNPEIKLLFQLFHNFSTYYRCCFSAIWSGLLFLEEQYYSLINFELKANKWAVWGQKASKEVLFNPLELYFLCKAYHIILALRITTEHLGTVLGATVNSTMANKKHQNEKKKKMAWIREEKGILTFLLFESWNKKSPILTSAGNIWVRCQIFCKWPWEHHEYWLSGSQIHFSKWTNSHIQK